MNFAVNWAQFEILEFLLKHVNDRIISTFLELVLLNMLCIIFLSNSNDSEFVVRSLVCCQ